MEQRTLNAESKYLGKKFARYLHWEWWQLFLVIIITFLLASLIIIHRKLKKRNYSEKQKALLFAYLKMPKTGAEAGVKAKEG